MANDPDEATSGRKHGHGEGSGPRGPHRGHVDEAAGGADSSPLETEPSGSKHDGGSRPGPACERPRPAVSPADGGHPD